MNSFQASVSFSSFCLTAASCRLVITSAALLLVNLSVSGFKSSVVLSSHVSQWINTLSPHLLVSFFISGTVPVIDTSLKIKEYEEVQHVNTDVYVRTLLPPFPMNHLSTPPDSRKAFKTSSTQSSFEGNFGLTNAGCRPSARRQMMSLWCDGVQLLTEVVR